MTDTPDFIAKKQFEIVMSKTVSQRLQLTDALVNQSRILAVNRIRKAHVNCTEKELKYLIIKQYYGSELGEARLNDLKQHFFNS